MSTPFKNSPWHGFQQATRRRILAAARARVIGRRDRDVLGKIVNLWFHHRAKGQMALHRGALAKATGYAPATIKTALRLYRECGVLIPKAHATGGRSRAPEYALSYAGLSEFLGEDLEAEWQRILARFEAGRGGPNGRPGSPFSAPEKGVNPPPAYKSLYELDESLHQSPEASSLPQPSGGDAC